MILGLLATYYITLVLCQYGGPFGIFSRIRNKTGELCFACLSVYIGIGISAIQSIGNINLETLVIGIGYAGGTVIINTLIERLYE
jgi:hypothetical protein